MYLLGVCQTPPDELRYMKELFLESRERGSSMFLATGAYDPAAGLMPGGMNSGL